MTLSEEQKELIRSLFNTGTYGIKWYSFIAGNTYYVNSLEERNIQELLSESKKHGPYVITSNNKHCHLITSIHTLDTEEGGPNIKIILDSYYNGALSFKELLNSYR